MVFAVLKNEVEKNIFATHKSNFLVNLAPANMSLQICQKD